MTVHEFPSWPQDHGDAFSGVVDEVSEDDGQALQSIPLDVEELVCIRLDYLEEDCHPLVEGVVEAVADELVVDAISPGDRPQA